jgi:hypothetical protein
MYVRIFHIIESLHIFVFLFPATDITKIAVLLVYKLDALQKILKFQRMKCLVMTYEVIYSLVFSLIWRHNDSTKLCVVWVPVAYSLFMYYYLGDQTAAPRDGKGLYCFSVETWREEQFGWLSRVWESEVTLKELVCEDMD